MNEILLPLFMLATAYFAVISVAFQFLYEREKQQYQRLSRIAFPADSFAPEFQAMEIERFWLVFAKMIETGMLQFQNHYDMESGQLEISIHDVIWKYREHYRQLMGEEPWPPELIFKALETNKNFDLTTEKVMTEAATRKVMRVNLEDIPEYVSEAIIYSGDVYKEVKMSIPLTKA